MPPIPTPLTLTQLLNPPSRDGLLTQIVSMLSGLGFSATDWETDSDGRIILQVEAQTLADLWQAVYKIAQGGYLDTATGDWLTLLAQSQYQLTRNPPTQTIGEFRLTAAGGVGPYTFNKGDLVVTYFDPTQNNKALIYRSTNAAPVVVNPGTTRSIQVTADSPGSAYNIAPGSVLVLNTPRPGLTVDNQGTLQPAVATGAILNGPFFTAGQTLIVTSALNGGAAVGPTTFTFTADYPDMTSVANALNVLIAASPQAGRITANVLNGALSLSTILITGATAVDQITIANTGTANISVGFDTGSATSVSGAYSWISEYGQDNESDTSLITRCINKWATIGTGTKAAFISWATSADPDVQKVAVYSNLFNGTPKAGAVTLYIAGIGAFDIVSGPVHANNVYAYIFPKLPIMTELFVAPAARNTKDVVFTAKIKTQYNNDTTKNAVFNAVQNLFFRLTIGETLYKDQVIAAIITIPGIVDATLSAPGIVSDIVPAINELITLGSVTPNWLVVV
ncbi:MAG: hypothetical protein EKK57_11065 [Proteobacteria bacterium]|nr:MAG: hypothetical protein EKK57_11065 [Pseudomonadota bacterium]